MNDVGHEASERYIVGRKSLHEIGALIRRCYAISAREAERLLRRHAGDLSAALDELGESDDSPAFTQHDAIEQATGTVCRPK